MTQRYMELYRDLWPHLTFWQKLKALVMKPGIYDPETKRYLRPDGSSIALFIDD